MCQCDLDRSYSLGFREGVMWVKAVSMCKKDAERDGDFDAWSFFVGWMLCFEVGR